jgi:hypothetical protein
VNTIQLAQDLAVPEAQDAIAAGVEICRATTIVCFIVDMLAAVDFDDEHKVATNEVCNEGIDRHLPDEFETSHGAISSQVPKALFGLGR